MNQQDFDMKVNKNKANKFMFFYVMSKKIQNAGLTRSKLPELLLGWPNIAHLTKFNQI